MKKYKCHICNKEHPLYSRVESPLPAILRDMSDEEKEKRVFKNNETYLIDKEDVLIDGYIQIFHESNTAEALFSWQVWVSLPANEFAGQAGLFEINQVIKVRGKLESELLFYDEHIGLEIEWYVTPSLPQPIINIMEECEIKFDQSKPIDDERLSDLMSRLHHRELYEESLIFDEPFSSRLKEVINENNSKKSDSGHIINICSSSEVIFQILPRVFLEEINDTKAGFGFHVVFDEDDEVSIEQLARFKETDNFDDWDYHILDGIPAYQFDAGSSKEKVIMISNQLFEKVFLINEKQVIIDSFEV